MWYGRANACFFAISLAMQVIVDRLAIEYTDQGAGQVILMLHGWLDNHKSFDALANILSTDFRVIRLDLPGFGNSQMPPADWAVGDFALFVGAFLSKLDVSPEGILGHSFGGRIALKGLGNGTLAAQKLILIGSAGVSDQRPPRRFLFCLAAKLVKSVGNLAPFRAWYRTQRKRLYARLGSDYLDSGKMQGSFVKTIAEDLSESAARITMPTLLIWGADDEATPLSAGQKLHRLIAGSQLEVLAGAGHFVHRQQPEAVARLIRVFV